MFGSMWHVFQNQHLRKHSQRLCLKAGLHSASNSKPGRHLEYDHPAMEKVRSWIGMETSVSIHPLMVGNFDQVWSVLFKPKRTNLVKKTARHDEYSKSLAHRKLRHCLERCLGLPLSEAFGEQQELPVRQAQVQGGHAANVAVEQWRVPRTFVHFIVGKWWCGTRLDNSQERHSDRNTEAWSQQGWG